VELFRETRNDKENTKMVARASRRGRSEIGGPLSNKTKFSISSYCRIRDTLTLSGAEGGTSW
jgi:hypothetical protein